MRKFLKIGAFCLAVCMIAALGLFIFLIFDTFYGNPIALSIVRNTAERYIQENHPNSDYEIEDIVYRAQAGGKYEVQIKSPTGIDEYFNMGITKSGEISWNSYDRHVESGYNTKSRLQLEYVRFVAEKLRNNEALPYEVYGDLRFNYAFDYTKHEDALLTEDLEINKIYDIEALGIVQGLLIIRQEVEAPTVEKASEILLLLKQVADEAGVPFYRVKLELYGIGEMVDNLLYRKPKVDVREFFYPDIYEEELVARVQVAHEATCAYYETHNKSLEMDI